MTYPLDIKHSPSSSAPIGIFDSGVGGISILKEIQKCLPQEHLIYIADSAYAPYGDKSADFIQQRSLQLAQFLLTLNIKVLVVACNTATTEAIVYLRKYLPIPVVGVEPAIKPAAEQSRNNIIGILATHRTIQSKRLRELIRLYAFDKKIIAQACPGLVEAVENNESASAPSTKQLIQEYTQVMINKGADTIILGCTHYPFLLEELRQVIGEKITILDTGKPVAYQLQRILKQNGMSHQPESDSKRIHNQGSVTFYSSLNDLKHYQTLYKLWKAPVPIKPLPDKLKP